MVCNRRFAASRLVLSVLALLGAFAQPVGAVLHGTAHQREASHITGAATQAGNGIGHAANESIGGLVESPDHEAADHPALHEPSVATLAWILWLAAAVTSGRSYERATVVQTMHPANADRPYRLAFHELLPDQPRAPPLG